MQGWEEIAAYYQTFALDPHYAAFSYDMLIAVAALSNAPVLMLIPREVAEGMIVFTLPNAARRPALGWFKPRVYSVVTRDTVGKLYDAQLVTLNGVISGLQGLIERLPYAANAVKSSVSR